MFELVKGTQAASLYIAKEADDFAGLSHVAEKIQKDIELVTGVAPKICDAMPEGYSIIPGTIGKNPVIDEMIANKALDTLKIDGYGLDSTDRSLLKLIIEKYDGGPVGIETLAAALGEDVRTLEDVCEPFLLQAGLLQRTPRGRKVTPATYRHLGYKNAVDQQSLF